MVSLVSIIAAIALAPGNYSGNSEPPQSIEKRIADILPTKDEEKWMSIPWRFNLMQARKESFDLGKPLFMWMMNGHPFGCT